MEYPFEVFVSVYSVLAAFAVIAGGAIPAPLADLLPHAAVVAWGLSLGLGGGTVGTGLLARHHRLTAMGLRLVTVSLTTYLLAFLAFAWSPDAIPSALLLAFIVALAGFRSFYFRTLTGMVERVFEEE